MPNAWFEMCRFTRVFPTGTSTSKIRGVILSCFLHQLRCPEFVAFPVSLHRLLDSLLGRFLKLVSGLRRLPFFKKFLRLFLFL